MLGSQRHLFSLPEEVSYLNCAYMSPQLKQVEAVGMEMIRRKSLPFSIRIEDFFQPVADLKTAFAQLVNVREPGRIAVVPSASYGLANVARNLSPAPGGEILVAAEQFPSNVYPWQRLAEQTGAILRFVSPLQDENRTKTWNEAFLASIGPKTAMVAIGNVHWADGTFFDLAAIRERTREYGALLVIDGTQSVGALPLDVEQCQPDALIVAGYKWLLGPYGIGLAYYGPHFDDGLPIEENWINRLHSEDFQHLVSYQPAYQPLAARFSVGEQSNFILTPMLSSAIRQLLAWGVENIRDYCRRIAGKTLETLQELGVRMETAEDRCAHLFGLRLPAHIDPDRLKQALTDHRVMVSFRGDAIRVSPHVYNDEQDFEKLLKCFKSALK